MENKPTVCETFVGKMRVLSCPLGWLEQVNTAAAEVLYQLAGEWAGCGGRTLLFDVCCGTGTIGLTLAKSVAKVIGVDIVESAIQDAKSNADRNGGDPPPDPPHASFSTSLC